MKTLLLDQTAWDLVLDTVGNIALASDPYSMAQDVASAVRTFQGEVYYDTRLGVPWLQSILGRTQNAQLIKAQITAAALTVPSVASATCFLTSSGGRVLGGQVQARTAAGTTVTASGSLAPLPPPSTRRGRLDYSDTYQSSWIPAV